VEKYPETPNRKIESDFARSEAVEELNRCSVEARAMSG
jgi:hypothetical protein